MPSSAPSSGWTTAVTPGTRSFMIRSMPAFMVTVDAGQLTQAPCSSTVTTPRALVDVDQGDVATVGLDGRTDDLDHVLDLRLLDHWAPNISALRLEGSTARTELIPVDRSPPAKIE